MKYALILAALAVTGQAATAEKVAPAYVPEQAQASAMAVPVPEIAKPSAIVVVQVNNEIVGIIGVDVEGNLHPLNIEGLSEAKVKYIIAGFQQKLVANLTCNAPDKQPIF